MNTRSPSRLSYRSALIAAGLAAALGGQNPDSSSDVTEATDSHPPPSAAVSSATVSSAAVSSAAVPPGPENSSPRVSPR